MRARRDTIVAVDGPGGAGKTSVSRGVAHRLGLAHLDTGAFYRAATIAAQRAGADVFDEPAVTVAVRAARFDFRAGRMLLDGTDVSDAIRSPEVTAAVSPVSAIPEVREVMVARQRQWVAERGGSAVVEGRDIGTVVFPDAAVKVFLTARPGVRAARRAAELPTGKAGVSDVEAQLERRDRFDSTRKAAPLRPAVDAVEIDTSDMTIAEVVDRIVGLVEASRRHH